MRLFLYPFLLGDMSDLNFQVAKSVAEQAETLWQTMIFSGPLFGQVLNVGLGICCLTIGFFAIELTFNSLEGQPTKPITQLIWPALLAVAFAGSGIGIKNLGYAIRNSTNNVSHNLIELVAANTSIKASHDEAKAYTAAYNRIGSLWKSCDAVSPSQQLNCMKEAAERAKRIVEAAKRGSEQPVWTALQQQVLKVGELAAQISQDPSGAAADAMQGLLDSANQLAADAAMAVIQSILFALSACTQYAIEFSFVWTCLLGPLAMGASLLPTANNARPVILWLTGFASIAIAKFLFILAVGTVSIVLIRTPNADPAWYAVFVGIAAPIAALCGGWFGGKGVFDALSNAATSAASAGVDIGLRYSGLKH